jgi:hypothetical protein
MHLGRESFMTQDRSPAQNPDQLREQIDRGETGDKVDFLDPAVAPLGTDDEAANRPSQSVAMAPERVADHAAIEAGSRKPSSGGKVMVLVLTVAAIAALAMIAGVLV